MAAAGYEMNCAIEASRLARISTSTTRIGVTKASKIGFPMKSTGTHFRRMKLLKKGNGFPLIKDWELSKQSRPPLTDITIPHLIENYEGSKF
jgi:hypothetical protein